MNRAWLRALLGDKPRFDVGVGQVGGAQRQFFMTGAVEALKASGVKEPRLLEIGSWIGYSTFTWASALRRSFDGRGTIVCIDPWEDYAVINKVHAAQMVDAYRSMLSSGVTYDLFSHNISYLPKGISAQPLRGRSSAILPLLREASFDLVYIDGNHTYEAVRGDIEASLPLLKPGGVLCGDDLELVLEECDVDHARANRDAQPAVDPKTGQPFHPGVTLAVADTIGSVANYLGFWGVRVAQGRTSPLELGVCFMPGHIDPKEGALVLEDFKHRGIIK